MVYYYENSELKIYIKFIGTRRGTRCIAHLNDKSTGNKYLLVASEPDVNITRIRINSTLQGLSTPTKQYFKYVVRQWMDVSVTMWPSPDADYDLYGKWTPDTLPQGTLAGDPINDTDFGLAFPGAGVPESAGSTLGPGTYYLMVHNYSGTGTYDLSVIGFPINVIPIPISNGETTTLRGLSTPTKQYFKYIVRKRMYIGVIMSPTPEADYDLYVKWEPDTLPQIGDYTDCGQPIGAGFPEACADILAPGTYYIMVHNYSGTGTYNLSVWARRIPTWYVHDFEDQNRGTKLRIGWTYFQFEAPSKTFSIKRGGVFVVPKAIPDMVIIRYEDSEIRVWAIARVRGERDFCIAFVKDMKTGTTYLLIDRWR